MLIVRRFSSLIWSAKESDRQTYDHGRGYTLVDLETAIDTMDVTTLKRFRQAACTDPVAVQVLGLNRAKECCRKSRLKTYSK